MANKYFYRFTQQLLLTDPFLKETLEAIRAKSPKAARLKKLTPETAAIFVTEEYLKKIESEVLKNCNINNRIHKPTKRILRKVDKAVSKAQYHYNQVRKVIT